MAFWGVEVKPGKPITHSCEKARGRRLRISQVTLGFGNSLQSTVLQCNVGKRSPILLCVLLPGKTESSHIELEFQEADDVVFSVIGPRSVYLSGYYVQNPHSNGHSDTESYGVDIENTSTDGSDYNSDDGDDYEDSFINDNQVSLGSPLHHKKCDDDGYEDSFSNDDQVSPGSPLHHSKEGLDGITPEKDKQEDKKGRRKLHKRRLQVVESDSDESTPKTEDEDDLDRSNRYVKTTTCEAGEKIDDVTVEMDDEARDDDTFGSETNKNVDSLDISDKMERVTQPALDEEGTENDDQTLPIINGKDDGKNETLINQTLPIIDGKDDGKTETLINQTLPIIDGKDDGKTETLISQTSLSIDGKDNIQSLDLEKPKKKRKKNPLAEETSKVQTDNEDPIAPRERAEHEAAETLVDLMGVGEDHLVTSPELDSENGQKSKKRKSEQHEIELAKETDEDNLFKQDLSCVDGAKEHLTAANKEYEQQQKAEETSMDRCGVESHNVPTDDEAMQEVHAESKIDDVPGANAENKEQIDSNVSTKPELLANEKQPGKIKKKKKKTQGKEDLKMSASQMSVNQGNEDESTKIVPIDSRTLSNGLTIEELGSGPPGGKVAAAGKKIKIFYTGILKENGKVFDSNVGKSAYKFQLGDNEYIDGWNAGIDGMRVGDKRRLIIPPSMGFGDHQVQDQIPPNSWLIYEIELARVYR